MKKLVLTMCLITASSGAFAKQYKQLPHAKKAKAIRVVDLRKGQKTIVCGKAGSTLTAAVTNINNELKKPQVQSYTAKNLKVSQPFKVTAPSVHSEKTKTAEVYVACVKIKKT